MIFERRHRRERITLEGRKAAAFRRRQARELERYPLLAAEIAESQINIDEAESNRNAIGERAEQNSRDREANVWRKYRAIYFASGEATRAAIRTMWSSWTGPLTCTYFAYVVDVCTGEFERRATAAKQSELAVRRKVKASMGLQIAMDLHS